MWWKFTPDIYPCHSIGSLFDLDWLQEMSASARVGVRSPYNRMVERGDGPTGCVDKIPTCHHFMVDYDACNPESEYFQYIEPNCMATCGLCSYDQGTLCHWCANFLIIVQVSPAIIHQSTNFGQFIKLQQKRDCSTKPGGRDRVTRGYTGDMVHPLQVVVEFTDLLLTVATR